LIVVNRSRRGTCIPGNAIELCAGGKENPLKSPTSNAANSLSFSRIPRLNVGAQLGQQPLAGKIGSRYQPLGIFTAETG
jgi:hypothetical protein